MLGRRTASAVTLSVQAGLLALANQGLIAAPDSGWLMKAVYGGLAALVAYKAWKGSSVDESNLPSSERFKESLQASAVRLGQGAVLMAGAVGYQIVNAKLGAGADISWLAGPVSYAGMILAAGAAGHVVYRAADISPNKSFEDQERVLPAIVVDSIKAKRALRSGPASDASEQGKASSPKV